MLSVGAGVYYGIGGDYFRDHQAVATAALRSMAVHVLQRMLPEEDHAQVRRGWSTAMVAQSAQGGIVTTE